MGNCTGTNSKLKPIKSLQKANLQDQENTPPANPMHTAPTKITFEQAARKRDALKLNLQEESLDPPIYFIHKIDPLGTNLAR